MQNPSPIIDDVAWMVKLIGHCTADQPGAEQVDADHAALLLVLSPQRGDAGNVGRRLTPVRLIAWTLPIQAEKMPTPGAETFGLMLENGATDSGAIGPATAATETIPSPAAGGATSMVNCGLTLRRLSLPAAATSSAALSPVAARALYRATSRSKRRTLSRYPCRARGCQLNREAGFTDKTLDKTGVIEA